MDYIVPALIVVAALIGVAIWIRHGLAQAVSQRDDAQALALLQNQMHASAEQYSQQFEHLRQSLQTINGQISQSLENTQRSMGERLDRTAAVIQNVNKELGQLGESTRHIHNVGKDIASLQETLQSPKLRGNISELFLNDLLAQILPPTHYRIQHTFRGGETVDAAVVLQAGMVPVDAKFPLENFRRVVATQDEVARKTARKAFLKDVKTHVDAIASKYIRTDEGTFDFALMYIPAENVYYETIIKDEETGGDSGLFNYALNKRVIPVSPNSFYAYLQTILLGLKGMRVEESAREIINNLARLQKEFERFGESFRLVGKHLENAQSKYGDAVSRLGKIEGKMEQIDGVVRGFEGDAPGIEAPKDLQPPT